MLKKIFLLFGVLNAVFAITPLDDVRRDPNCINMTEENEIKINAMVDEIVEFLDQLSARYDEFDVRSLKLQIDKHSNKEGDKNTVLDVTVNDCKNTDNISNAENNSDDGNTKNSDEIDVNNDGDVEFTQNVKPSLVLLELPRSGEELLRYLKKKRGPKPFIMYINGYKQILLP